MVHVNPHYDLEWEKIHDRHAAERARLGKERDRLAIASAMNSDAYKQVSADFDWHHKACLASFMMRDVTVQGYAEWLFRDFDVSMGNHDGGIPIPLVDLEQLLTMEEADAAWLRIHRAIKDSADEKRNSPPTCQPAGLAAFADVASPGLARYWRAFSPRELYPIGYNEGSGTRTLMTVDEQANGWHVCFMHDCSTRGVSVTNAIEQLATAVYREASAIAEQQLPKPIGVRAWFPRWPAARMRPPVFDPARFHFYQHIPPRSLFTRKQLDRVEMDFRAGEYRAPEWMAYPVIPELIQLGRFDCARDASLTDDKPHSIAFCDQRAADNEL